MARPDQLEFGTVNGWGGKRRGAVCAKWPLHITQGVSQGVLNLRRRSVLEAFARAAQKAAFRGLKFNQFVILKNHLHMIAECSDNLALANGMQAFGISFTKAVKRISRQEGKGEIQGKVFAGRYHMHVLKTPSEVRKALKYVLFNETKHDRRRTTLSIFSSSFAFSEVDALDLTFTRRERDKIERYWRGVAPIGNIVSPAESWLGRTGWKRAKGT
jgi:REP element-mobilizing transposase RayT